MKSNYKQLFLWFVLYYIVTDVIRGFMESDSIIEALEYQIQPNIIALTVSVLIIFFLYAVTSYTIFFKLHDKKPFWFNTLFILTVSFALIGLRYLVEEVAFRSLVGFGNYKMGTSLLYYYLDNFYYVFQYCAIGVIYYFWQYSKYKDDSNTMLLMQNQQMELDLIRSQTNPHFLFNTLNNIYALVFKNPNKALEAIEKLSFLLRYTLYKTKDLVSLKNEVEQINHFIDLEVMRHKLAPNVKLQFNDTIKKSKVPQYILLPFVENAFKHGDLNDEDQPIEIDIKTNQSRLTYIVKNKIAQKKKDDSGGLGLDNLKKRLRLLFEENHTFSINKENGLFIAKLEIPIQ